MLYFTSSNGLTCCHCVSLTSWPIYVANVKQVGVVVTLDFGPVNQLSWLSFLMVFLIFCMKMLGLYL